MGKRWSFQKLTLFPSSLNIPLRISDNIAAVHLHQVRLDKKSRLARAGTARFCQYRTKKFFKNIEEIKESAWNPHLHGFTTILTSIHFKAIPITNCLKSAISHNKCTLFRVCISKFFYSTSLEFIHGLSPANHVSQG